MDQAPKYTDRPKETVPEIQLWRTVRQYGDGGKVIGTTIIGPDGRKFRLEPGQEFKINRLNIGKEYAGYDAIIVDVNGAEKIIAHRDFASPENKLYR